MIRAIGRGATVGPRIVRAGLMMSQTGGHGDAQGGPRAVPDCACSLRSDWASIVADGPDAVLKASRHLLRDGSDFLKIHVSGGVATPSDPIDSVQYTPAEIRAAVTEATHRGTYVAAHAYLPEAIAMAVSEGVTHDRTRQPDRRRDRAAGCGLRCGHGAHVGHLQGDERRRHLPRSAEDEPGEEHRRLRVGTVLTREGDCGRHHAGVRHRPDRRDAAHAEPGTRHPGRGRATRGRVALDVGGQCTPVPPGGSHRRDRTGCSRRPGHLAGRPARGSRRLRRSRTGDHARHPERQRDGRPIRGAADADRRRRLPVVLRRRRRRVRHRRLRPPRNARP